jgi:putative tricarboxylic transport membrane protein
MEQSFFQSLLLSDGTLTIFIRKPISLASLLVAVLLILSAVFPFLKKRRRAMLTEEQG